MFDEPSSGLPRAMLFRLWALRVLPLSLMLLLRRNFCVANLKVHSLSILQMFLLLLLCSLQLFWQLYIHFQGVLPQVVLAFISNIFLMLLWQYCPCCFWVSTGLGMLYQCSSLWEAGLSYCPMVLWCSFS